MVSVSADEGLHGVWLEPDELSGLMGGLGAVIWRVLRYRAEGVDELVLDFIDRDQGGVPDLAVILEQPRRFPTEVLPEIR